MSMTDPDQAATRTTTAEVRGQTTDSFPARWDALRETTLAFLTTEFWFTLAGVAGLIVVYNVADDPTLDLWRTCLLATLLGVAYVVSRGLAKSGSRAARRSGDYPENRY